MEGRGWLRMSKRFTRIYEARMPVNKEPQFLGLVVGRALVDPGYTVTFMPYFSLENLREGLGVRVFYTITHHEPDYWADARNDRSVPVNLEDVKKTIIMDIKYVTLMAFYDFGENKNRAVALARLCVLRGMFPNFYCNA